MLNCASNQGNENLKSYISHTQNWQEVKKTIFSNAGKDVKKEETMFRDGKSVHC